MYGHITYTQHNASVAKHTHTSLICFIGHKLHQSATASECNCTQRHCIRFVHIQFQIISRMAGWSSSLLCWSPARINIGQVSWHHWPAARRMMVCVCVQSWVQTLGNKVVRPHSNLTFSHIECAKTPSERLLGATDFVVFVVAVSRIEWVRFKLGCYGIIFSSSRKCLWTCW